MFSSIGTDFRLLRLSGNGICIQDFISMDRGFSRGDYRVLAISKDRRLLGGSPGTSDGLGFFHEKWTGHKEFEQQQAINGFSGIGRLLVG